MCLKSHLAEDKLFAKLVKVEVQTKMLINAKTFGALIQIIQNEEIKKESIKKLGRGISYPQLFVVIAQFGFTNNQIL